MAANVQQDGADENISEYMRDPSRRDMERKEQQVFDRLKAEQAHAFAAPGASHQPLTPADVIARNAGSSRKAAAGT